MKLVLQQKQQLNLSMTSELRQAIELLQYSTYELERYIRQQELENPLIELVEKERDNSYRERLNHRSASDGNSHIPTDIVPSKERNMRDEIFEHAKFAYKDEQTLILLKYIIDNLDDNGYLSIHDNTTNVSLNLDENQIIAGIHLLQQIGPVGIGARDLKECLLLQIVYKYPENRLAKSFVEDHLGLIADRKWTEIASRMNISMENVKELYEFVQKLDPKPCSFISDFTTEYLTPDIIVELKNNEFLFHLNDRYLPTISLNNNYSQYLNGNCDIAKYLNGHHKDYQWLLSSIEQRRNTIIKIVGVLLERQKDFFMNGFISLKPLTLREVAEEIDMHESTVSRATMNKVIQTPFGSFELRALFTSKLETTDGNSISQMTVKTLLQNFVDQENTLKPLSDQKIADYFRLDKRITISRRTISKYREELKIPASSKRKDIKV